jgi:undecaprenyl-diphosphatase
MAKTIPATFKRTQIIRRCLAAILLVSFHTSYSQNVDIRLLNHLHATRDKTWDETFNTVSWTVYPVSLAIPIGQYIHGIATHDMKSIEYGLQSTTALVVNTAITYGLKYSIRRDRPYVTHPEYIPYEHDSSPSFPSGHTSFAFTTATDLSIQYRKWYVIAPAYLWAGAVGYSRIHMGAHYPSDVLAGAIVGAASAYISYQGNKWLKGYWTKKTEERFKD